jgi:hypothetical protein
MRKALVCVSALCALAMVRCGSSGPVPGAPPSTVPNGPSIPTVAPPDAGPRDGGVDAGVTDAGTPLDAGSPDAGLADAGTVDAGTPDAGLSADCEGLVPAQAPGSPVQITTDVFDGNGDACLPGQSDGAGSVVVGMQSAFEMAKTDLRFYTPAGELTASQSGRLLDPVPQLSGFETISPFLSNWELLVYSSAGAVLRDDNHQRATATQANDPLGGLAVFDGSRVISFDAGGNERWELPVGSGGSLEAFAVDRAGNLLLVLFETNSATEARGLWISHDGAAVTGWFPMPVGRLVPRVGDGFFVQGDRWVAQLDGRGTSTRAPPAWLAALPGRELHMVHGGRGYAVLPAPLQSASPCEQEVEVRSPSGARCGAVTFHAADAACTTMRMAVGYDGTVFQGVPHETEGCTTPHCLCAYRWWPHYFD